MISKYFENVVNWGLDFHIWALLMVPKYENCSNFRLDEDTKVVEGSLDVQGHTRLNEIKIFWNYFKFRGLGWDFYI